MSFFQALLFFVVQSSHRKFRGGALHGHDHPGNAAPLWHYAHYRGYPQTVRAIALVLEDESRLLNVTEEIYEVVALQTRCHPSNVERNIRTVVLCAWHTNRPLLVKMAGFTLTAPPRASQFIDIIASYIQREVLSDPSRRVLI